MWNLITALRLTVLAMVSSGLSCALTQDAEAQRALTNTGFEANDPQGPGTPNWQNFNDALVPGWDTTTNEVELWDSGFQSVPSHSGSVHAEMNANTPGAFYQNICIEDDETVGWTFAHRARPGGSAPNPQVANLEIATLGGTVIQTLASQSTAIGAGWQVNSGSALYAGTGGVVRVQFRTTNPGSFGNFLDTIEVDLSAYVQFAPDTSYGEASTDLPGMEVNGTVGATTTVPFTLTGGTATSGDDFTIDTGFITVPAGVYSETFFPLPLTIINDTEFESLSETLTFSIGTPSSSELKIADASCGAAAKITLTHEIIDDDPNMQISKLVSTYDPDPADGEDVYALPGNDVIYTFTMSNSGNGPVDNNSLLIIDKLPSEITFYNGDIDDAAGPESNPISFSQSSAGLSFSYAADVGYSKSASLPVDFSDCSDTPAAGYDETITYVCINPDGAFAAGPPDPTASFSFRARIN